MAKSANALFTVRGLSSLADDPSRWCGSVSVSEALEWLMTRFSCMALVARWVQICLALLRCWSFSWLKLALCWRTVLFCEYGAVHGRSVACAACVRLTAVVRSVTGAASVNWPVILVYIIVFTINVPSFRYASRFWADIVLVLLLLAPHLARVIGQFSVYRGGSPTAVQA